MNIPDRFFQGARNVLDVGGWFKPDPRATHVVDLMPWETRGARLELKPLPQERFSKASWFQADFLKPELRLPFADKSFDLVICGHTIEDLANPKFLLIEMERVGRRGVIECPSRLTEQTKGIRDRESSRPGHPHHHWIVESVDGWLLLYSKEDSLLRSEKELIPLSHSERCIQLGKEANVVHTWENKIDYRFISAQECQRKAQEFIASLDVSIYSRIGDSALRFGRRMRSRLRGRSADDVSWWPKIVEASRPYSSIELK
jgi:SAM-dependent methyltransferase